MTYGMDDEGVLCAQNLIDDSVIADPELVEAGEITRQRKRLDRFDVLCKPLDPPDDAARDLPIESGKLARAPSRMRRLYIRIR